MTRPLYFDSPLLLGFDHVQRVIDRVSKSSSDGYPPYNIEQLSEKAWRITLAVAGFKDNDLSVTLEDRQLVIRGKAEDQKDREFLHRGIAMRQFSRTFVIADGVEVSHATLNNGLLSVDLERNVIEGDVKSIKINNASTAAQEK